MIHQVIQNENVKIKHTVMIQNRLLASFSPVDESNGIIDFDIYSSAKDPFGSFSIIQQKIKLNAAPPAIMKKNVFASTNEYITR